MQDALVTVLKSYAASVSDSRPVAGRLVRANGGQHAGRTGVVLKHMRSRYEASFWRYLPPGNAHAAEIAGRHGFVCLVEFSDGGRGWVRGEHAEVVCGGDVADECRPCVDGTCHEPSHGCVEVAS